VFLVATGDELVDVAATPSPYQIRMSNMVALEACLHRAGFSVGKAMHLPDREESLRSGLVEALAESDVLLISGGVSKGSKDLVPPVLLSLGCTRVFHGVAHKPGKPMWFGFSAQGAIIFALPGNPVSSLVCFLRYVLPRLRSWGEARNAGGSFASSHVLPLVSHVEAREGYTLFLPALLEARADGSAGVRLRKSRGSGDFAGLHPSDGIVELPAGAGGLPAGTPVRFLPWP
jgi:molybdopterin molybdotransferase